MKDRNFAGVFNGNFLNNWDKVANCKKPVIAAVNGYAVSINLTLFSLFSECFSLLSVKERYLCSVGQVMFSYRIFLPINTPAHVANY